MKKREFLKLSSAVAVGTLVLPITSCGTSEEGEQANKDKNGQTVSAASFTLPALPYAFDALAPHIDAQTMEIHHDKHHAGYVRKLNNALAETEIEGDSIEAILANVDADQKGVRNNGGGHYNHSLFWNVMGPDGGGQPSGDLLNAINAQFGSFEAFSEQFATAAKGVFGSGWAWLCVNDQKELFITSTPNQDNPMMKKIVSDNGTPILGIDVWEHAYYLNYQNKRGDYIANFFDVINWNQVEQNMKANM